uniref:Uncharacterized protein n=1 Tax=Candidatus Kentrum eta TaxID=2126337 RepID=A0A450VCZ7_9GAMM|nr:MAG: hypothetical protein BECKH772B_GA0070898_102944 [Candidatus Kentron sp. H]VFK02767.1 MAG: hypothetical protein BECKH772A_GA0070896_102854 [Candidatus Kentron sp. H]VFK05623.1 MAG: hypothetical protein BECKH772C_GA0070978_102874 [Candidatus Kentron sp. H]
MSLTVSIPRLDSAQDDFEARLTLLTASTAKPIGRWNAPPVAH